MSIFSPLRAAGFMYAPLYVKCLDYLHLQDRTKTNEVLYTNPGSQTFPTGNRIRIHQPSSTMTRKQMLDNDTIEASSSDANACANVEASATHAQRPTSFLSSTLNTPILHHAPSFPAHSPDVTPTLVITPSTLNSILGFIPAGSPLQSNYFQNQDQNSQCLPPQTAQYIETATTTYITADAQYMETNIDLESSVASTVLSISEPVNSIPQTLTKRSFETMETQHDEMTLDASLAQAAVSAMESGTMTPLIKEELKYSIQNKRLRTGKNELKVEFKDPEPERLSNEEKDKRQRRRERNRLAAQRCRNKRRGKMMTLEDESKELMQSNSHLRKQIRLLERERQNLSFLVKCHDVADKCPHNTKMSTAEDDVIINDIPSVASSEQTMSVFDDTDTDSDTLDDFDTPGDEVEVSTSHKQ